MDVHIIRPADFICLVGPRRFDFAASKEALGKLAYACQKRGIKLALLDLRAFKLSREPIFSPDELASLVNTFHEMGFSHEHRLAVLYRADPHHRLHLFALIGRLRGWTVAAFDNFEDALSWMAGGRMDEIDVDTGTAHIVPIKVKERSARVRTKSLTGARPMKMHPVSTH